MSRTGARVWFVATVGGLFWADPKKLCHILTSLKLLPMRPFVILFFLAAFSLVHTTALPQSGCTDPSACNYDPLALINDGGCSDLINLFWSLGSEADPGSVSAILWSANASYEFDGLDNELACVIPGCYNLTVWDYSCSGVTLFLDGELYDSGCAFPVEYELVIGSGCVGCTDPLACNYRLGATSDDGSCDFESCAGCDGVPNSLLVFDDCGLCGGDNSSCTGCTDSSACNFEGATIDDGSCLTNDDCGVCGGDNSSCSGCTHENATNYDSTATIEDGSCLYNQYAFDAEYAAGAASVECPPCPNSGCPGDFTGDGYVGVDDILFMLSLFDTYCWQCGDPLEYQGYSYGTVLIGGQCWFSENLRSQNYENGDAIPSNLSNSEWQNTILGSASIYGEDAGCINYSPDIDACDPAQSLNEYGRLYNWYAVDDARGLCPSGWRVATDGEWTVMTDHLGGAWIAGGQMKTDYGWNNGGNGTNLSGFAGLPGGGRYFIGNFDLAGRYGNYWSSSPNGSSAWFRTLVDGGDNISVNSSSPRNGFSVRCMKEAE